MNEPLIIAVVPAFNRCEKTLRFLREFTKINYPNKRVIVVDDGSSDNTTFNIHMNFPDVPVLQGNGNLWWSGGTNLGIRHALELGAAYILTINDDALMADDFLDQMMIVARQNPKHIVGCRLHREDKPDVLWGMGTTRIMRKWDIFALNYSEKRWEDVKSLVPAVFGVDGMPGNGVLLPKAVFSEVGFYDARNMPQYHADTDLVLRAKRKGFVPVIATAAVLYNHILTKPLVNNRWDLILSRKSDRYWRAVRTTCWRHGPKYKAPYLLFMQYVIFFAPQWLVKLRARWNCPKAGV